jgi:hypothetical protein
MFSCWGHFIQALGKRLCACSSVLFRSIPTALDAPRPVPRRHRCRNQRTWPFASDYSCCYSLATLKTFTLWCAEDIVASDSARVMSLVCENDTMMRDLLRCSSCIQSAIDYGSSWTEHAWSPDSVSALGRVGTGHGAPIQLTRLVVASHPAGGTARRSAVNHWL